MSYISDIVEMFCGMKCRLLSSLMLIVLVANVHDGRLSKHWQFKLFLQEYKSDDHILLEISSSCIFRRHFPIVILTPEKKQARQSVKPTANSSDSSELLLGSRHGNV